MSGAAKRGGSNSGTKRQGEHERWGEDTNNRIRRRPRSTEATQDRNDRVVRTGVSREETTLEWSVRHR